jgi:GH35 family endo-1,4-beta-xylanase
MRKYLDSLPAYTKFIGALILLFGVFLVIPTRTSAPNPSTRQATTEGQYGVAFSDIVSYKQAKLDQRLQGVSRLGFKWIRLDFNWNFIQPANAHAFNWTAYDRIVAAASKHHLKVLGIIDYTPLWARPASCKSGFACAPANMTQFATFASSVAARYKNKSVNNWEIWNEENITKFWAPAPDARQYAGMLKQTYPAIKKANPSAFVILGGMAVGENSSSSGTNIDAVQMLQQLYEDGVGGSFNAVGYHPYTYPRTALDPGSAWAKMENTNPSLRSIMTAHGDASKQIWLTEYGAPTNGPPSSSFVNETKQAQMVMDIPTALKNKSWAGPFFWYTYQDHGTDTGTAQNFFGLLRADGSEKPAYTAWQSILAKK